MIIMTSVGTVDVASVLNSSLDQVILTSKDAETLREVLASLELAGVSEDHPETRKIGELVYVQARDVWTLVLDRTTFKLWVMFEVDHYLSYGSGEFPYPVCGDPGYISQVETIKRELGLA